MGKLFLWATLAALLLLATLAAFVPAAPSASIGSSPLALITPTPTPTPRTVGALQAGAPPTIDGDLSDWGAAFPLQLNRYTADTLLGIIPGFFDSSADLWAVWQEEAIYVAVHVRDNRIISDSADVWRDDEIELAFDGAHDLVSGGADDHQYTVNADGRKTDFGYRPVPEVTVGVRPVTGGWDVEVRIPAAHLQAGPLFAGKTLGFTLGLHDDDNGRDWDSYMIWEGENTVSGAAGFGVMQLSGAIAPTPVPSATTTEPATSTPTETATPSATPTASPTATPTSTPTATATSDSNATATPTRTATPTPTPSKNPTSTATPTSSTTPTLSPTPTSTSTATPRPTPTPRPTATEPPAGRRFYLPLVLAA